MGFLNPLHFALCLIAVWLELNLKLNPTANELSIDSYSTSVCDDICIPRIGLNCCHAPSSNSKMTQRLLTCCLC
jgi:hypothetical protein